jgi:MFS family permease
MTPPASSGPFGQSAPTPPGRVPTLLLGSLIITGIGQTLLYALLPLASRSLSLSGFQSSSVFALAALFWSLSSPFWGRMSDRQGGMRILIVGLAGQGASNLAVGLAILGALHGRLPHGAVFPLLLVLRGINGVLGSAVLPAAQSLALRCAPHQPRITVVGRVATCWTIGLMAGPGFAAAIAPLGLAVPLLAAAGMASLAALLLAIRPIRAGAQGMPAAGRPGALRLIRRRIRGFMVMQLAIGTASSLIAQSTGFYVQDGLKLAPHPAILVSGLALSLTAGCSVLAQIAAIRLRPPPHVLMAGGALVLAASVCGVLALPEPAMLIVAMGAAGAGMGAVTLGVSTAASLRTRPNQQGGVAGTLASAGSLGAIVSALGVMPFYERFVALPYGMVALLAFGVAAGAMAARGMARSAKRQAHGLAASRGGAALRRANPL